MIVRALFVTVFAAIASFSQMPPIQPGVSHDLAKWRASHYSDVRYKLDLTLEKMSPVLKGTMEIRVRVEGEKRSGGEGETVSDAGTQGRRAAGTGSAPLILDWRKIRGSEQLSTISNVSINGAPAYQDDPDARAPAGAFPYIERDEHLIFDANVVAGENVIKLDFTSPILTSGSAITRYVDKEDGSEYIYSLFVPSDASTAFPVFDQPDLKARFNVQIMAFDDWKVVSNARPTNVHQTEYYKEVAKEGDSVTLEKTWVRLWSFAETKPISTYVFAFAAGPFAQVSVPRAVATGDLSSPSSKAPIATAQGTDKNASGGPTTSIFVRKSQAEKFKPHAAEVFRLNREGIKFLEGYFDYKFPFPKYDIVLIPEFPFGGMEHAGATFLRESSVIFPQEPTKNDFIARANVIFHEAAHQWFGDTVTMRWFDDLWLKEGFAEFMAYKTLERVMPEYNAWKVFYERNKQAAYLTDSTKGTTPIYQEIANLNAAKSAYGNIVYRKAPSFLKQAEFYLGPDKFQTAVRSFLKKHEYANAGWEDLVKEFEGASGENLKLWADAWVKTRGVPRFRLFNERSDEDPSKDHVEVIQENGLGEVGLWPERTKLLILGNDGSSPKMNLAMKSERFSSSFMTEHTDVFYFPNYDDYGYGIFLLDRRSRDYVLKNIHTEKDDFLRTMMWGSLWDSVREAELDPREYVELVLKSLSMSDAFTRDTTRDTVQKGRAQGTRMPTPITPKGVTLTGETDESTIQTLLGRVSTAMNYYMSEPPAVAGGLTRQSGPRGKLKRVGDRLQPPATAGGSDLRKRVEDLLIDKMQNASTPGQRITYYRSFLSVASTANARRILKEILRKSVPGAVATGAGSSPRSKTPIATAQGTDKTSVPTLVFRTKDKFDIVTRLLILGDPDAPSLLAALEKTETSDEAKRYAYAARAGIPTAENKAKYWNDFVNNKDISESWIEAAFGPFNSIRHSDLTLRYLQKALEELPNHKRNRKIFFVNGWLGAFIGGQKSDEALAIVNKFLADNPNLDRDLRLKILENVDLIERAVKIRNKFQ